MNKETRENVYQKYDGHCAYCGCEITIKNFQVDHIWPQFLAHHQAGLSSHRFENLNPACRKCNNFKHGMRLEEFRSELEKQVEKLRKNAQFDRALRYNQIEICESPIRFFFEKGERKVK